jgi:hypothetical protein
MTDIPKKLHIVGAMNGVTMAIIDAALVVPPDAPMKAILKESAAINGGEGCYALVTLPAIGMIEAVNPSLVQRTARAMVDRYNAFEALAADLAKAKAQLKANAQAMANFIKSANED